ncbi:MAG: OmpA family protein [Synergistaceae bacterium]|nr:OmpA family protein [Synergistaceae bacterium]
MEKMLESDDGNGDAFTPIADLMSGLMIIFLFIALLYMRDISREKERIENVAVTWSEIQSSLYEDLFKEFRDDLPKWTAEIDRATLSVRFSEPSVFFEAGSATLTPRFKEIILDFFPRYLNVLRAYKENISEVRIEGHTSSEWGGVDDPIEAYFRNMELSQNRTRAVLEFVLRMEKAGNDIEWARRTITANGLSSSHAVVDSTGKEDAALSRRVEFRVRTDAEQRIVTILQDR